ncbi:MAG TPA: hypothetical protein PK640_08745 [Verrucomicrobiota bacterium]|nr:hypothetical protein [Verrucomicrobiota bacterium]
MLAVLRVRPQFLRGPDYQARLPGFGRTEFSEDAVDVVVRFARQIVFDPPEYLKERIRLHALSPLSVADI